jgi:hypothetical protein
MARLWFKLTAGPLLRGIQAVLQELAGSATGWSERGMPVFGRRARFARGYPPATQLHGDVQAGPAQFRIGRARWHQIWCADRHAQERSISKLPEP